MRQIPSKRNVRLERRQAISGFVLVMVLALWAGHASAQGSWSTKAPMPTPRVFAAGEMINGRLFIAGGSSTTHTNIVESYDPSTDTWRTEPSLGDIRMDGVWAAIGSHLYIAAGVTCDTCQPGVLPTIVYDTATGLSQLKKPLPVAAIGAMGFAFNGLFYVAGGAANCCTPAYHTLWAYNPSDDTWTTRAPMPTARNNGSATVVNGKVYVVGGNNASYPGLYLNAVEIYDPATDSWSTGAPLPQGRSVNRTVLVNGRIVVIGGATAQNAFEPSVLVYDPYTNTWSTDTPMPAPRQSMAAGAVNGVAYTAGGYACCTQISAATEAFTLAPAPPAVADAGADQTAAEGTLVTLDGSGSTGTGLAFQWMQLAGPPVDLTGATSATPSFIAPLLPGGFGSQTLTFRLTVNSGSQSSNDTADVTVVNVNHYPVAEPGADQAVNEGSAVALDGSGSYDPDGDAIAFAWSQVAGPPVALSAFDTAKTGFAAPLLAGGVGGPATLTFALMVTDGELSDTRYVTVTVEQVNHAPVATAGPSQTVNIGSVVTLDGTGSSDSDNDSLSYMWTQIGGPSVALDMASTAQPTFTAPGTSGPVTFALVVSDGVLSSGNEAQVTIAVVDANPRCEQAYPSASTLWPPDHRMTALRILGVTNPSNEAVTIETLSVMQDEPITGLGEGDTAPDAVIQPAGALLRAERSGLGDGRIYTLTFRATDTLGVPCVGTVRVGVPHDQGRGKTPVDSGQMYDSTQP